MPRPSVGPFGNAAARTPAWIGAPPSRRAAQRLAGYQPPVGGLLPAGLRTTLRIFSTAPADPSLSLPANSLTWRRGRSGSVWRNVPLYPRPAGAQNDSVPLTRAPPRAYSPSPRLTASWFFRPPYARFSSVNFSASGSALDPANSKRRAAAAYGTGIALMVPVFLSPNGHDRGLLPLALLVGVLVLLAPSQTCLVRPDGAGHRVRPRQGAPRLPAPVQQEPRRALAYSKIFMQLRAGYALGTGGEQVRGYGPVPVADFGVFHDGPDPDAEALVALRTVVRHARVLGGAGVLAVASGTPAAVRPHVLLEPLHGGPVVGERVEQFRQGQVPVFDRVAFAVCLFTRASREVSI